MDYIEVEIEFSELKPWRDILISEMAEYGYESFVETKTGLKSYIAENNFLEEDLKVKFTQSGIKAIHHKRIVDQNWNAKWEENFDPVLVDKKVAIRAPFHGSDFEADFVLTIQPQMSFGTGHHQTTWLMCQRIADLELKEKAVLDMGTGTGVLAVLAEKKGAKIIVAPDIDEWSYNNALENVKLNDCERVEVVHGGHETLAGKSFDLIIANINKNILVEHFSVYSECLKSPGKLLISGFFETDSHDLKEIAAQHGFIFEDTYVKDEWALMEFSK